MGSPSLSSPKNRIESPDPMAIWKERLSLFFVLGVMSFLLLRGIGDPSLVYPDADRLLMDGVFIHDFMREMPVNEIYEFTSDYYAQYPALSIGYRPPFFPFVEALFNGVFGINMWSSRDISSFRGAQHEEEAGSHFTGLESARELRMVRRARRMRR